MFDVKTMTQRMADGKLIAVLVRWRHNDAWRELVLMTAKKNPASF